MRHVIAALLTLCTIGVSAQNPATPQFEVVSIKRNTSGAFPRYIPPGIRPGQFSAIAMTARDLIGFGFPARTLPAEILGLPAWASSDQYDVMATLAPTASQEEQQQMWRALLNDRMKLQAHYETRERAGYDLVFAREDRRSGPELRPSTIDCDKPPAAASPAAGPDGLARFLMSRCNIGIVPRGQGIGLYSGGTSLAVLARMLASYAKRPIADRTGLSGNYAIALRFANNSQGLADAAATDDLPTLFTALQEQLGLKLQAATVDGQVLVVDHIERPSEN